MSNITHTIDVFSYSVLALSSLTEVRTYKITCPEGVIKFLIWKHNILKEKTHFVLVILQHESKLCEIQLCLRLIYYIYIY